MPISPKDEKILNTLRHNCKLSTREISQKVGMPITTVHNRIKRMEKNGVVTGYVALVDSKKLGKSIHAIIEVNVTYTPRPGGKTLSQQKLAETIYAMPEVEDCYITTGKTDIFLHVAVKDVEELNSFVINKLRSMEGVEMTTTAVVLSNISENMREKKYGG